MDLTPWPVSGPLSLRTCSAEDLVVHKVFAGRDRDWADVEGIVSRQGPVLDVPAIVAELSPLLELKSDPEGLDRFQRLLR